MLDGVFALFLLKVVNNNNYYYEEVGKRGDLEKMVYSNLESQLESTTSKGFDFKQVQQIINDNKEPSQQPSSEQTGERQFLSKFVGEKYDNNRYQPPALIPLGNANRILNTSDATNDCL